MIQYAVNVANYMCEYEEEGSYAFENKFHTYFSRLYSDTCLHLAIEWICNVQYCNDMHLTVADPGFSKWGGAVLSQMGGRTSCFQVKSA